MRGDIRLFEIVSASCTVNAHEEGMVKTRHNQKRPLFLQNKFGAGTHSGVGANTYAAGEEISAVKNMRFLQNELRLKDRQRIWFASGRLA